MVKCYKELIRRVLKTMLVKSQLRRVSHVVRMADDGLIIKVVISRKMKRGGQKLRHKDFLKSHLKRVDTDVETWHGRVRPITDIDGGRKLLMVVSLLREPEKEKGEIYTWKDGCN